MMAKSLARVKTAWTSYSPGWGAVNSSSSLSPGFAPDQKSCLLPLHLSGWKPSMSSDDGFAGGRADDGHGFGFDGVWPEAGLGVERCGGGAVEGVGLRVEDFGLGGLPGWLVDFCDFVGEEVGAFHSAYQDVGEFVGVDVVDADLSADAGVGVGEVGDPFYAGLGALEGKPVDDCAGVPLGACLVVGPVGFAGDDVGEAVAVDVGEGDGVEFAEDDSVGVLGGVFRRR